MPRMTVPGYDNWLRQAGKDLWDFRSIRKK